MRYMPSCTGTCNHTEYVIVTIQYIKMENTPPDTIAVRKALLNHRKALADLRDSSNLEESFKTPKSVRTRSSTICEGIKKDDRVRYLSAIEDLVLYKNPVATVMVVVAGSFITSFGRYITSESTGVSLITIVCNILLTRVGYHVGKSIFSTESTEQTKLVGSREVERFTELMGRCMIFAASLHDEYITADNPYRSLTVAACLWGLSIAGRYFGISQFITIAFLGIFTIPYAIHHNAKIISHIIQRLKASIHDRWSRFGLTKFQRNGTIVFLLFSCWVCSGWSNRLIGLLMVLLWIRCTLRPHEMKAIREQAAPLTRSVKKSARRWTMAFQEASEFASRSRRT